MELDAPLFNMSPLNKSSAGPSHGKPRALRQSLLQPYASSNEILSCKR